MADNFDMKKFLVENQTGPYAKAKLKKEEGYMGTQYNSSEDMAVDMLKKGITREEKKDKTDEDINETVDNRTLMTVEK